MMEFKIGDLVEHKDARSFSREYYGIIVSVRDVSERFSVIHVFWNSAPRLIYVYNTHELILRQRTDE